MLRGIYLYTCIYIIRVLNNNVEPFKKQQIVNWKCEKGNLNATVKCKCTRKMSSLNIYNFRKMALIMLKMGQIKKKKERKRLLKHSGEELIVR